MMYWIGFIIGFIVAILISILIVATLVYFRRILETKIEVITKQIESVGPKPKGFIVEPESDEDEARSNIIAENKRLGRDTTVDELR